MTKSKRVDPAISEDETLARYNAELAQINSRLLRCHSAIRKLNAQLGVDEARKRELTSKAHELQNMMFARSVLQTASLVKVRSLRRAYLAKLQRSNADDITVKEANSERAGLKGALAHLQSHCSHPLVFSYDGYRGSASDDWDDARHGYRVCTVCNFRESSGGTDKDIYAILKQDETRLVRRDLRRTDNRKSLFSEEWFALDFLEELFAFSAGGININWPAKVDKNSQLSAIET